ncbi:MAG: hypothetical protein GXY38_04920 [Planctomycetes bacterium]|nr:hypothetical protein [Planctomycetota bacterium]
MNICASRISYALVLVVCLIPAALSAEGWHAQVDPAPADLAFKGGGFTTISSPFRGIEQVTMPSTPSRFMLLGHGSMPTDFALIDLNTNRILFKAKIRTNKPRDAVLSPDGRAMAFIRTRGARCGIEVLLLPWGKPILQVEMTESRSVRQVDFGADHRVLALREATAGWNIEGHDTNKQEEPWQSERYAQVSGGVWALSPGRQFVAIVTGLIADSNEGRTLRLIQTGNGKQAAQAGVPDGLLLEKIAFSPGGDELSLLMKDSRGNLRVITYDAAKGTISRELQVGSDAPLEYETPSIEWIDGGRFFLIAGRYVVDRSTGEVVEQWGQINLPRIASAVLGQTHRLSVPASGAASLELDAINLDQLAKLAKIAKDKKLEQLAGSDTSCNLPPAVPADHKGLPVQDASSLPLGDEAISFDAAAERKGRMTRSVQVQVDALNCRVAVARRADVALVGPRSGEENGREHPVQLLDLVAGQATALSLPAGTRPLCLSDDGKKAVMQTAQRRIDVFTFNGDKLRRLGGFIITLSDDGRETTARRISDGCFVGDDQLLLWFNDGTLSSWRIEEENATLCWAVRGAPRIFTADGKYLAGLVNNSLRFMSPATGQWACGIELPSDIGQGQDVAFGPSGNQVAIRFCKGNDHSIGLVNLSTRKLAGRFDLHDSAASSIHWTGEELLLCGSFLYRLDGAPVWQYNMHHAADWGSQLLCLKPLIKAGECDLVCVDLPHPSAVKAAPSAIIPEAIVRPGVHVKLEFDSASAEAQAITNHLSKVLESAGLIIDSNAVYRLVVKSRTISSRSEESPKPAPDEKAQIQLNTYSIEQTWVDSAGRTLWTGKATAAQQLASGGASADETPAVTLDLSSVMPATIVLPDPRRSIAGTSSLGICGLYDH